MYSLFQGLQQTVQLFLLTDIDPVYANFGVNILLNCKWSVKKEHSFS